MSFSIFLNKDFLDISSNKELLYKTASFTCYEDNLHLNYKELGIEFIFSYDLLCKTVFVTMSKVDFFNKLCLDFPIKRNTNVDLVNKLYGKPNRLGRDISDKLIGYNYPWDSYYFKSYTMHVTYEKDLKHVRRVSFMTKECTPGRN